VGWHRRIQCDFHREVGNSAFVHDLLCRLLRFFSPRLMRWVTLLFSDADSFAALVRARPLLATHPGALCQKTASITKYPRSHREEPPASCDRMRELTTQQSVTENVIPNYPSDYANKLDGHR